MEANENSIKLYYNTEVEKLQMPEYGRNVLKMVELMKTIPDREKRTAQAAAIVKVMELPIRPPSRSSSTAARSRFRSIRGRSRPVTMDGISRASST